MANSKGDPKSRKVMDVTEPGKSEPSASSRPIIVSNRPMLRRDPMMAPAADAAPSRSVPVEEVAAPTSRMTKAIKIMPLSADETEASTLETPVGSEAISGSAPAPIRHTAAIAMEVGQEALASMDQTIVVADIPANEEPTDQLIIEPVGEPEQFKAPHPGSDVPADLDLPTEAAPTEPTPSVVPDDASASIAPDVTAEPSVNEAAPSEEPAAAKPDSTPPDNTGAMSANQPSSGAAGDSQFAPNQLHAEQKRKIDQAEVERQAEIEKLVNSNQYYLPIATHEKQRGTMRAALVLLVVIVVAIVWFDAVLDAGIVHIPNVQAPTHFFEK